MHQIPYQKSLFALALAACAVMASSAVAATGEVTLSGSTWTGKVDGVTKYTGSSMGSAVTACNNAMTSGSINIRNSGNNTSTLNVGSNRWIQGNGVTITSTNSGTGSSQIFCRNSSSCGASNINMKGTSPWFGIYFESSSGNDFYAVNGQGGGIAYRIDNCKGAWGATFRITSSSVNVSGSGGHGIETMGIQGSTISTVTSNDHADGCGVLIQSYNNRQTNTASTVLATRACYGCGYAGFRTANTNRNQTLTYDDATSCGRGYFSVSTSQDCTITRVNATSCSDIGCWLQSSANTHVSGGTIQYCGSCSAITSPLSAGNNTVTVTCR